MREGYDYVVVGSGSWWDRARGGIGLGRCGGCRAPQRGSGGVGLAARGRPARPASAACPRCPAATRTSPA